MKQTKAVLRALLGILLLANLIGVAFGLGEGSGIAAIDGIVAFASYTIILPVSVWLLGASFTLAAFVTFFYEDHESWMIILCWVGVAAFFVFFLLFTAIGGTPAWIVAAITGGKGGGPTGEDWPLTGKISISVSDLLGGDPAALDGTAVLYKGTEGALTLHESVTMTDGAGETGKADYESGQSFYVKITVGNQFLWYGPKVLPYQKKGSTATKHAWSFDFIQIDTSAFAESVTNKGTNIANYGSYNGTTSADDYPQLNYLLSETVAKKGYMQSYDPERKFWRQLVVVVRKNNSEADQVKISTYPDQFLTGPASTDDRYYAFVPTDHLYIKQDSQGRTIDGGTFPFTLGLEFPGLTQGKSVRFCVELWINSNLQYWKENAGHPTGATKVATLIIYVKA